jgi:glyoxylase-like metal-dependent hydrolase (beta-lactamase superfamily II)
MGATVVQVARETTGCLSYVILDPSSASAAVVDPTLAPAVYIEAATSRGCEVTAVWETHTHADHISTARDVARHVGVPLHLPAKAGAAFDHHPISDGQRLRVGDIAVRAIATAGHTPDAMTFLAGDEAIVGDTLLVGTVGRADFYPQGPEELYHSIFDKILRLADSVRIHPCHFGPQHGLPEARVTTMANERVKNEALTLKSKDEFIRYMTEGWPPQPHGWKEIMWANTHDPPG